jgi:arginase
VTRVLVPYHLDEHLPDLDVPVPAEVTVTADLPAEGGPWQRLAHLYQEVATVVADAVGHGAGPAVFAGDCTTSLGTVAGLQRAGLDPAIVWFDAHGDVQTPETTSSGYLGGMPLRLLAGYRPELIAARLGLRPVPEDRILLTDARDLDPPEVTYLESAAIRRLPVTELTALPDGPIYLHVDLDVVDPADLPGLRFPAPGGPRLTEVAAALHRVVATGRVAALGFACTWQPGRPAAGPLHRPVEELLARWKIAGSGG